MFSSVPRLPFHSSNKRVIGEEKVLTTNYGGFSDKSPPCLQQPGGPRYVPHRGQRCHCAGRQRPGPPEGHAPIMSPRWLCTQVSSVCPVGGRMGQWSKGQRAPVSRWRAGQRASSFMWRMCSGAFPHHSELT